MASLYSNEWKSICEKFSNALHLTEVESRNDPSTQPYNSMYKARTLLEEVYCSLKSIDSGDGEDDAESVDQQSRDEQREDPFSQGMDSEAPAGLRIAQLAAVQFYLGVNHADTEELKAGENRLKNCMELLGKLKVSSENVSMCIHVRNKLGILSAGCEEFEDALKYLETAETLYQRYTKEVGSPPFDMSEYFATEENKLPPQDRTKKFELAYTHTMYYLAQVLTNLGEKGRAAAYCHATLQRQLQLNQFNSMEWALNAATLSQYYISKGRYMEGRHCLSAATVISGPAGEIPSETAAQDGEMESETREHLRRNKAEISRCWIKYCLNLLQDAKEAIQDDIGEFDSERQEELKRARKLKEEEEEKERKSTQLFGSEDTFDQIASQEEKVPCFHPLDFTEARAVFLTGQSHVTQAKEYFLMDGFVTDHIEILQDHSALFRSLAFFEEDLERRCKMHKRRVDMLEPVCNELNSQYYLMIRRQLMFELAETYNEMMDLKLTLANRQADSQSLDNHIIKKFNQLCAASAKYFQMFLDSLRSPEGKFPERLEQEVLRPALVARFRVARLYNRLISSIPSEQLENLSKSLENYKFLVQYCEEQPDAAKEVETELELSREMVGLLPLKINRITARMAADNQSTLADL